MTPLLASLRHGLTALAASLFQVSYLPGRRQGASDLRVNTGSASMATTGSTGTTSSNGATPSQPQPGQQSSSPPSNSAQVRTTSDADFWTEVQASLNALIGS